MEGRSPVRRPVIVPGLRIDQLGTADPKPGEPMAVELHQRQVPARHQRRDLHRRQGRSADGLAFSPYRHVVEDALRESSVECVGTVESRYRLSMEILEGMKASVAE